MAAEFAAEFCTENARVMVKKLGDPYEYEGRKTTTEPKHCLLRLFLINDTDGWAC
ncbi:hypothetical protein HB779_23390 (plasmid) [Phyllobacterium sp. 628]|uniref:hypothetical protein n=1 Tax=Phyllobacterium sp. 628 TaxID=2718938 RepID=UPI001662341A|nr:hypothetical protein [Phyllobacterium sp. 628]QND54839.1 hypothetical protein HB779_23390 [Phyllobacterium sp. 628]